jgi:hypothetical protein
MHAIEQFENKDRANRRTFLKWSLPIDAAMVLQMPQ